MIVISPETMAEMHAESTVCENCCGLGPLECHHIFARGAGGGQRLDVRINLIMLCKECHEHAQRNRIPRRTLLALAAEREIYRLRRLPKVTVL